MISVIIPANNEARFIGPCLDALLAQDTPRDAEIIVAANGCTDDTVAIATGYGDRFAGRGWRLEVLDIAQGSKPGALNRADAVATGDMRVYLDADVGISPPMLEALARALDRPDPAYASGRLRVVRARSWVSRAYGRIWRQLPFMTEGVPGAGLFAVNGPGRARWDTFPPIISDDTFVRLSFAPTERILVDAPFTWPLVEGFAALVRVRKRQDQGVGEVLEHFPELEANADTPGAPRSLMVRLAVTDPVGFAVYVAVRIAARITGLKKGGWDRGAR